MNSCFSTRKFHFRRQLIFGRLLIDLAFVVDAGVPGLPDLTSLIAGLLQFPSMRVRRPAAEDLPTDDLYRLTCTEIRQVSTEVFQAALSRYIVY